MLSRRHIRVKVMQALYGADSQDTLSVQSLEKSLDKNINRLYEAYLYLLSFLTELGNFAQQYDEEQRARYIAGDAEAQRQNIRFFQNPLLQRVMHSEMLAEEFGKYHVSWKGDDALLRRVFLDLKSQEIYKEFTQFGDTNPVLNQEILIFILRHYAQNMPSMQSHLEEEFVNWPDDKKIVIQMAGRTIQNLAASANDKEALQPLSINSEDIFEFAHELLKFTLKDSQKIDDVLAPRLSGFDKHQIAKIDMIILRMATAEFLHFPAIPGKVTINEYIELSKNYSTPQSKKFVNGVLDTVLKTLKNSGEIIKN